MPKGPRSTIPEIEEDLKQKDKALKDEQRARRNLKKQFIREKIHKGKQDHYLTDSVIEDNMIDAIDFRRGVEKLGPILEKLVSEKFDPTTFFGQISRFAAAELASVAFTGEKEKNRLDALKHLLALGGHTATQKHEISRIDPHTEKEALLSIVRGAKKDLLTQGIEIVDDDKDYDQ